MMLNDPSIVCHKLQFLGSLMSNFGVEAKKVVLNRRHFFAN
jgi:hypothetical protein